MTSATKTRTRKQPERLLSVRQCPNGTFLWIAQGKEADAYALTAIAHDYGRAAFHLRKLYDGKRQSEEYDVLLDGQQSHCDCKGYNGPRKLDHQLS